MSPDFLFPARCDVSPREKGKTAFAERFSLKRPFSLSRVGKTHLAGGRKSRGSLISVPLALREYYDVVVYDRRRNSLFVEISPVNFPKENKVFQRPCRSVLPPS